MKTHEELKEFYESTLVNDLKVLEERRKGIVGKLLIIVAVALGIAGVGAIVMATSGAPAPIIIIVPLIGALVIGGIALSVMS
jgi:hypothetical protein